CLPDRQYSIYLYRIGLAPIIRKAIAHFRMNRSNTIIMVQVAMHYSYITETNDPIRLSGKLCEVQSVYNANSHITSPCAHNCCYILPIIIFLLWFRLANNSANSYNGG